MSFSGLKVVLPDYKKIASGVRRRKIEIRAEEIENILTWLQQSRAKLTLKNQPAQKGDFVEIECQADNNPKLIQDGFILGKGVLLPGFEEKLEGMKDGENKEFFLGLPKTERLTTAEQEVRFKVKMKAVQKVELPQFNEQFAQALGQFENLGALKKSIGEGVNAEKEMAESQRVRQEIIDNVSRQTQMEIPPVLIKTEQKRLLEGLKKQVKESLQISFEDYLTKLNQTEAMVTDNYAREAEKRVKNALVLRAVAEKENIEVAEAEVAEEINKLLKQYPDIATTNPPPLSSGKWWGVDLERIKEYTKEVISTEKTLAMLESFANR